MAAFVMNKIVDSSAKCLNIVLLGSSDKDKARVGNLITRQKSFQSTIFFSVKRCVAAEAQWRETLLNVIKTPDFFELPFLSATKEIKYCMNLCTTGPTALLLIVAASEFTEERRQALKSVVKLIGQDAIKHSMVILTQSENLLHENLSVEDIITDCNQRQYRIPLDKNGYRNNLSNNTSQELMEKIQNMMNDETQDSWKAVTLFEHMNSFSKDLSGCDKNTSVNIWPNNEERNITFKNQNESSLKHDHGKISNLDGDIIKISATLWKKYLSERLKMLERDNQSEREQHNTVHKHPEPKYKDEDPKNKDDEQSARKIAEELEMKKRCKDLEEKHAEDNMKLKQQHEKMLEYEKKLEDNEKMLEECRKKLEEYEKKLQDQKSNYLKERLTLLYDHNNKMKHLMQKKDERLKDLTYKHQLELTHEKLKREVTILHLTKEQNKLITSVVEECDSKTTIQKENHMKEIINLKQYYENKIQTLQQESERTSSALKKECDMNTAARHLECLKIQKLIKQIEDKINHLNQQPTDSGIHFDFSGILGLLGQVGVGTLNQIKKPFEETVKQLKKKLEKNAEKEKKAYEDKILSLKENSAKEKMEIKQDCDKKMSNMKEDYEKQISALRREHNEKTITQKQQFEKKIGDKKTKHETRIKDLIQQNEEKLKC